MSAVSFQAGFIVLFCVSSLAGLAVLWWLALRRPRTTAPSCGHCGYAVEGLETLSCPECGSDLRKVGIETPKARMMAPWVFVLFWTILLIAPLVTAYTIALWVGPKRIYADASFGLRATSGSMPALVLDMKFDTVSLGQRFSGTSATASTTTLDGTTTSTITFPTLAPTQPRPVRIDVRTEADAAQQRPARLTVDGRAPDAQTIDRAAMARVFAASNGQAAGSRTAEDEAEVIALLEALRGGDPAFTTTRLAMAGNNRMMSGSSMVRWYPPTLLAIGVAIYALGIAIYLLLRKRRLATSAE